MHKSDAVNYTRSQVQVKKRVSYLYSYIALGRSYWQKCEILKYPDLLKKPTGFHESRKQGRALSPSE